MTITEEVREPVRKPAPAKAASTPFKALTKAAFLGFVRDRATMFWALLFPLLFLVIFGLLFAGDDGPTVKMGVVGDGPVISALQKSGAVEFTKLATEKQALDQVKSGDLPAYVAEHSGDVTLRFAASDRANAGVVQGLVNGVADKANLAASGDRAPAFRVDARQVEDSSLKPIQYLTPGILAWAVSMGAVFGASMTLVTWRRNQVLRRLRLAPVSPVAVLGSRLAVAVGTALVQAVVFVGVASLPVFGLHLSGQWWLAIPLLMLGTLAFFAIGMLVGSFAKTDEAAAGAANLIIMPMAFLSGTFFPLNDAPAWLQHVSQVLPMRHLNDGITAVLARGQGIEAVWMPAAVLVGFTLVIGAVAARLFRWDDA